MKKLILSKIFGFLLNRLRSRFAPKSVEESKSSSAARHKKLSPKYAHLLKVAQLFKKR